MPRRHKGIRGIHVALTIFKPGVRKGLVVALILGERPAAHFAGVCVDSGTGMDGCRILSSTGDET
jgi:hypothetical protein